MPKNMERDLWVLVFQIAITQRCWNDWSVAQQDLAGQYLELELRGLAALLNEMQEAKKNPYQAE